MLKTYVRVVANDKAPEIVKGFIDKNGWPISTIITKPDSVRIYFSYKWYQYYNVYKVKQAVKRFERFKNLTNGIISPISMWTTSQKRQSSHQSNAKKSSKNSHAQSFKEILDAEMSKL